jgi:bifunctional ADP-heptose synthase (sugar kinase/adenylyltransferase)
MTVAIAVGATLEQAMDLSNCAAGHVVSRLGTTVCTPAILKEKLNDISL